MNLHRSKAAKAAASVAALAILIGPSAAGAWAQESPSPSPTAAPTDEEAAEQAHDDGKHRPTVPKDNIFNLGQSMQLRVNADGEQNAKALNFRWTVSQLAIHGPPDGSKDGDYVVPVPEGGALPRYLENFGFIHVEDGLGQWDMTVEDGWATQRSVSLFPQDAEPKIAIKTEFTLDGEPVKAQDIVGKDGLVTATYTLINHTTKSYDLTVQDLSGADVQTTAEGDSPMVAITKTLLPQRYIGLNTGAGLFGADGRGNNQVQWISLPFKPLAENSQASFGWAAYVTDAVIPSLLTQVSPLYIPAHDPEAEPTEEDEAASGSSPIPLDPAVAEIQAGLAQVISGLDALAASKGEPSSCTLPDGTVTTDALVCLENTLNGVIEEIAGAIPPDLPASLQAKIANQNDYIAIIDRVLPALQVYPTDQSAIQGLNPLDCSAVADDRGLTRECGQLASDVENLATPPKVPVDAPYPSESQLTLAADLAGPEGLPLDKSDLQASNTKLQGLYDTVTGLAPVDLPTTAEAVAAVKQDVLDRGGAQVVSGLDQVSAGVSQAKGIIAAYLSELSAEIHAAIQSGAASANEALIHVRGTIGALKAAAAESPLIYGPLPEGTPENTVLFAAYEFRIDAADTNHPYTLPRILIGLIALIAGGLAVKYVGNRNTA